MKMARASQQDIDRLSEWFNDREERGLHVPQWRRVVGGYQVFVDNVCDMTKSYIDWKLGYSPTEVDALRSELNAAQLGRAESDRLRVEERGLLCDQVMKWQTLAGKLASDLRAVGSNADWHFAAGSPSDALHMRMKFAQESAALAEFESTKGTP